MRRATSLARGQQHHRRHNHRHCFRLRHRRTHRRWEAQAGSHRRHHCARPAAPSRGTRRPLYLRSRARRVPARARTPPWRGAREQRGAQRGEERKTTGNTRRPRTATKESGLPVASPHAACAAPRAACVAHPLVVRAPCPPAVSGSGAKGAGARAEHQFFVSRQNPTFRVSASTSQHGL